MRHRVETGPRFWGNFKGPCVTGISLERANLMDSIDETTSITKSIGDFNEVLSEFGKFYCFVNVVLKENDHLEIDVEPK